VSAKTSSAKAAAGAGGKQLGRQAAGQKNGKPSGKPKAKPAAPRRTEPSPLQRAAWHAEDIVLGRVAVGARIAGALAVLGALGLAVRPFLPLGTVHGQGAGQNAGLLGLLGWLPAVVILGGAGLLVLTSRLTRVGLAVIGAAGAISIGTVVRSIWLLGSGRSTLDLPVGGQALRGDEYAAGSGLVLQLVVACMLVLALVAVLLGWTSTVMDDDGGLDRRRPAFTALGFFGGVIAAGAFSMSTSSSSIGIAPPPVTAQVGLERVAGLLLAAIIVVCCVLAPTLRPWLSAAGGWLGVAVMLGGQSIENIIAVHRSADLHANLGSYGQLVVPVLVLALAVAALLVRAPAEQPTEV
jgi:hypothetical protein